MAKAFASQGDMAEKKISFTQVGDGLYAFTAEGDPNSGIIIGEDSVISICGRIYRCELGHSESHLADFHGADLRSLGNYDVQNALDRREDKGRAV